MTDPHQRPVSGTVDPLDVLQETWLSWTARGGGDPLAGVAGPRVIDRTPAAVRQSAHRAREHVHARRPRYRARPRVRREATERFPRAALGGDIAALMEILAPDVTVWTDGGGRREPDPDKLTHLRKEEA